MASPVSFVEALVNAGPEPVERPIVRCSGCGLVQYVRESRECPRCRATVSIAVVIQKVKVSEKFTVGSQAKIVANIGKRMRVEREIAGLTSEELSALTGMTRTTISRYETNFFFPGISAIEKYAFALKKPIGYMLDGGAAWLEDELVFEVASVVRALSQDQRELILEVLNGMCPGKTSKSRKSK